MRGNLGISFGSSQAGSAPVVSSSPRSGSNDTRGLQEFTARYGSPSKQNVLRFLTFDRDNPNSILTCLTAARENARSVRECISAEMWEHVNNYYGSEGRG